jgi:hypothetical protein
MADHVAAYRQRDIAFETLSRGSVREALHLPRSPSGITASAFSPRPSEQCADHPWQRFPGDTHFRISYATTDERLQKGCQILCDLVG